MDYKKLLTPKLLALYTDGVIQIADRVQQKLSVGSLKEVVVTEDGEMIFMINWLAKGEPHPSDVWVYECGFEKVRIWLNGFNVTDFGKRPHDSESRLNIENKTDGPSFLLFSSETPLKLDPKSIKGFPTEVK